MFGRLLFAGAVLQLARAVCEADGSGGAGSCKTCGVTIGGSEYCGECNDGTNYAPVDGVCADAGQAPASTFCPQHDAGKCTQCESTSFKYKDGCYQPNDGKPGQTLCLMASGGVCTEAAPGYFVPTGAVNTEQSVIACGDTTGVAIAASGSTQKGVADCAECSAPDAAPGARADKVATCTKCGAGKYLKDNGCIDKAQCDPGSTNRFVAVDDPENGNRCVSCNDNPNGGVANCDTCAYDEQSKRIRCTKCSGNKYLKTTTDGITTCVEQNACTPDSFPVEDTQNGNKCVSCSDANNGGIDKCTACAPIGTGRAAIAVTCTACAAGYKPSADKTTCEAVTNCKTPECQTCNNEGKESEVCTECASGAYLTPTSQCIDSCDKLGNYYGATEGAKQTCKECAVPNCKTCNNQGQCQICKDGSYKNGDTCSPCHESCKTCTAGTANDCTECPTGRALKYEGDGAKGTCGDGCTTGQGSGACKTCGLTIDGASYCSECAVNTEYPQNGVCASATARAAATCKTGNVAKGACSSCTNGFLRMNGGCYETTKFPGKSVCTTTPGTDTCTSMASGYYIDGSNNLVVCSDGCADCTTPSTCTTCKDGYTKIGSGQTCTKCDPSCETCSGAATTCKACATGYYKTASGEGVCTSYESDSNGVAGVKGCMNCAPPSSSTGPVLCYLMKDDSTGGSTNRGGLSTGAIAGIAVAVVVVVGGLVGFLCWWFLCRGKA